MSLTKTELEAIISDSKYFGSTAWGTLCPETGTVELWPAGVVAQLRGSKFEWCDTGSDTVTVSGMYPISSQGGFHQETLDDVAGVLDAEVSDYCARLTRVGRGIIQDFRAALATRFPNPE